MTYFTRRSLLAAPAIVAASSILPSTVSANPLLVLRGIALVGFFSSIFSNVSTASVSVQATVSLPVQARKSVRRGRVSTSFKWSNNHAAVDDEDGVLYSQSRFDDTSFRALRMPPADSMALRGIATRLPYEHPAFEDAETLADTLMPLNINPVVDNREYDSRGYHDYRRPSAYRTRSGSVALITRERRDRIVYSAIVRNDDHRIAFRLTDFSVDVG